MQNCNKNICDFKDNDKDKEMQERYEDTKLSENGITNILASLNIESFGICENFGERDDDYDIENYANKGNENPCSLTIDNEQVTSNQTIQQKEKIHSSTLLGSNMQLMKKVDEKSIGTTKQLNITDQDNAFIKMGLNVLDKNLSKDKQLQILQSEYLKKDFFL